MSAKHNSDEELAAYLAEEMTGDAAEDCGEQREDDLKAEFQHQIRALAKSETAVGEVIRQAVDELDHLEPKELADLLVTWGIEAGVEEKYVRELVSRHLCGAGKRRRAKGAGRKAQFDEADLKAIAAFAAERVGSKAKGALRAAMAFVPAE